MRQVCSVKQFGASIMHTYVVRFVQVMTMVIMATLSTPAQSLDVEARDRYHLDMSIIQDLIGGEFQRQDDSIRSIIRGRWELDVIRRTGDSIEWSFDLKDARRTAIHMSPIEEMDTTRVGNWHPGPKMKARFITDTQGRLLDYEYMQFKTEDEVLLNHHALWRLFAPNLIDGHAPGETWRRTQTDSLENINEDFTFDGTMIYLTWDLTFTYDGVVDTLGLQAYRIRLTRGSFAIWKDGTDIHVRQTDSTTEKAITSGSAIGVLYFAVSDGVLLGQHIESRFDQHVDIINRDGVNTGGWISRRYITDIWRDLNR
jgi:hypothetical protein